MILRIRKRFPIRNLMLWMAMVCVFSYALLEHVSIPIPVFSAVKRPLLYIAGLCILTQIDVCLKNVLKRRYFYVVLALLALCMVVSIATYLAHEGNIDLMRSAQRLVLYLVEVFMLAILLAEEGWSRRALRFLYRYILVIVILTDVLMITGIVRFNADVYEYYLVGTKFTLVYMHMNLLVFWQINRIHERDTMHRSRWLLWGTAVLFIAISLRVNCMTGLLGSGLLIIILSWKNTGKCDAVKWMASPVNMNLCLLMSCIFAFVVEGIMQIPMLQYFVKEILRRNINLTGRMNIYLSFTDKMVDNWLLGYGYGNANQMSVKLFGYANTQNAILNWVLQSGIFGTALLVTLLTVIMRQMQCYMLDQTMKIRPLLALIYVYIALGTVEPTIDMSFILWFAILFMYVNNSDQDKGKRNIRNEDRADEKCCEGP